MIPVDDTWRGFGGLHGGLVAAWLLTEADLVEPLRVSALSVAFLRPVDPAVPVTFDVDPVHTGRTIATTVVRLCQRGRLHAQATVSGGTAADGQVAWDPVTVVHGLAEPETLARFQPPPDVVAFGQHVDIRPLTATVPGSGADEPRYDAWVRLVDPQVAADLGPTGTATVLLDVMPPGLFALWRRPRPVPTVELTIHFAHATPEPGAWHHIWHETVWAAAGVCLDQTELRTADGRLVAQARQTRRIVGEPVLGQVAEHR